MAHYAIIDDKDIVLTIVAADTIDGAESVFPNYKVVPSTAENPAWQGAIYSDASGKFIEIKVIDEAAPE